MISRASLNYSCLRGAFAQFNSMSGDFNRAWNFLIVQTSLRFLFRCWVDNCSFVFRGHIDQFYNYFCSVRIAVISSAVRVATRYEFFFLHFVKNVLFLIILLPLRKTILQRGSEICCPPLPSQMIFLEMFCHARTKPAVLCVLILLLFLFEVLMIAR